MIPSTTQRVPLNTGEELNEQVNQRTRESVVQHAQAHPETLERRLAELDQEWDTDRWMETVYAVVILAGIALSPFNPLWLILSTGGGVFLLSHALFGWDPLLPVYRSWGIRTSTEIDYEHYALKALRGDFQKLTGFVTPAERDAIARLEGEGGPPNEALDVSDAADPHVVSEALEAARK
jgi:hypothetical protein